MNQVRSTQDIGTLIRSVRTEQGYTQQELADYSGCSIMFLSDLENGKDTAQIGKVLRVIEVLGIDIFFQKRGQV